MRIDKACERSSHTHTHTCPSCISPFIDARRRAFKGVRVVVVVVDGVLDCDCARCLTLDNETGAALAADDEAEADADALGVATAAAATAEAEAEATDRGVFCCCCCCSACTGNELLDSEDEDDGASDRSTLHSAAVSCI
jgi:hypothetical protein